MPRPPPALSDSDPHVPKSRGPSSSGAPGPGGARASRQRWPGAPGNGKTAPGVPPFYPRKSTPCIVLFHSPALPSFWSVLLSVPLSLSQPLWLDHCRPGFCVTNLMSLNVLLKSSIYNFFFISQTLGSLLIYIRAPAMDCLLPPFIYIVQD